MDGSQTHTVNLTVEKRERLLDFISKDEASARFCANLFTRRRHLPEAF